MKAPIVIPDAVVRSQLRDARRIVIKVGSQVLTHPDGALHRDLFDALSEGIAALMAGGKEIVLVSSGAVALGLGVVGQRPGAADAGTGILGKQALAAVGQGLLMSRYRERFAMAGVAVAQLLLTHSDLGDRQRFLHARRVISELLSAGIVPIVNENDTVAVEEIRFGDNDALAAQVAHLIGADALLLLTEVDGLFTADPHRDRRAVLLSSVSSRDEALLSVAGETGGLLGTGGMRSKVLAARKAGELGVISVVANGRRPEVLSRVFEGQQEGTVFAPPRRRLSGKRKWIVSSVRVQGVVQVDAGAAEALRVEGRSLLLAGVTDIQGQFDVGDALSVRDPEGEVLGLGLSRYHSKDASRIMGLRTEEIAGVLGWLPARELVHRDDFVVAEELADLDVGFD